MEAREEEEAAAAEQAAAAAEQGMTQNSRQLLQMHGSNLTPFCKQLLFDIHNLEMKLHLLVKRSCQKGYYKGQK